MEIVGHEVFACFMSKGGRGQFRPQNAIQPESYNRSMAPQFAVHDHGLLRPRLPWQVRPLPWLWQVTARLAPRPSAAPIKVIYYWGLKTKPLQIVIAEVNGDIFSPHYSDMFFRCFLTKYDRICAA